MLGIIIESRWVIKMIIKTEGVTPLSDSSKSISFIAETANEGVALERLRRAIYLNSPIAIYSFIIGKDNTIYLNLSMYELVKFMRSLK